MAGGLLRLIGVAVQGALSAMLVGFMAHSLWVVLTARTTEHRLVALRQTMVRAVGGESRLAAPASRVDRRLHRLALKEVFASVLGDGAPWIEQVAREMDLFDQAVR
ncbi:MAG: hypothetical protein ACYCV5_01945 [Acidimicrobiales bacterium]